MSGLINANSGVIEQRLSYGQVSRISPNDSLKMDENHQVEICPEVWGGAMHGYPFYEEGFVINCTGFKPKPFRDVLSLLLNFANEMRFEDLPRVAEDLARTHSSHNNYSELHVVAGVHPAHVQAAEKIMKDNSLSYSVVSVEKEATRGAAISRLLEKVETKYVLITQDLIRLDSFSRLERLVRLLSHVDANYVGGSHRNATGHWVAGCYQMGVRNYTMKLVEGYDLSYNSCMYCDYLSGPFAARTELLKTELDPQLTGEPLYADLWFRSRDNKIMLSCPDAMFHTRHSGIAEYKKSDWTQFIRKHQLNKLILPYDTFHYSCEEAKTSCSVQKGKIIPLCCFQELTDVFVFMAREFDAAGIGYELEGGSNVGGVKIGGTLPWERDHDINLRTQNISAALKLQGKFQKAGYKLYEENEAKRTKCSNSNTSVNCGYMGLRSTNWRVELWGSNWLSNDAPTKHGIKYFTRLNLAGYWIISLSNPAAAARNQYNDDLMKHAEHWITLGRSTGWHPYAAGTFKPCSTPGFHGCFQGNYLPVGNLQFKDVWV